MLYKGLILNPLLILAALILSCGDTNSQEPPPPPKQDVLLPKKQDTFLPDKRGTLLLDVDRVHFWQLGSNYKSAQPNKDLLLRILKKYPISMVVRLNADNDKLSIEQEAKICKDLNVQFYYYNIEEDIQGSYLNIRNFLQNGNTLVHCRHGFDRSGAVMGMWMKDNGATDEEIIDFNRWKNYLQIKGKYYQKYWNAVFQK